MATVGEAIRGFLLLFQHSPAQLYTLLGSVGGKRYLNLGWWDDPGLDLEAASDELVRQVGRLAELGAKDRVLDVGFGFGAQDRLWAREFGCRGIEGINITPLHARIAWEDARKAGLTSSIQYHLGNATLVPFADNSFDKVVALECAFHFDTRRDFLNEALRVLRPGGTLAVADIIRGPWLPHVRARALQRFYGYLHERFWQIPRANRYGEDRYRSELAQAGFESVELTEVSEKVLFPFAQHHLIYEVDRVVGWPRRLLRWVEAFCLSGFQRYVFVKARKPGGN